PVPGYDVRILDAYGAEAKSGETGEIVVRLPLPPGCLPSLWRDDERFVDSYMSQHPGFYITGDGGYRDSDGYLYVMGRIDDVINVAGHRLSTGQMEEVLASHPAVAECAVIGVNDEFKGQIPRGFVVLKAGVSAEPATLSAELVQLIRDQIGPVAALRRVDAVAAPGAAGRIVSVAAGGRGRERLAAPSRGIDGVWPGSRGGGCPPRRRRLLPAGTASRTSDA